MNSFEKELLACCDDYQVVDKDDANLHIVGKFLFPKTFIGFQGHFPTQPVLPAVIQLAMVRLLAEQVLTQRLFPKHFSKTKFRHIVKPEQPITTDVQMHFTKEQVGCQFQLRQLDGTVISDGNCIFTYL